MEKNYIKKFYQTFGKRKIPPPKTQREKDSVFCKIYEVIIGNFSGPHLYLYPPDPDTDILLETYLLQSVFT